MSYDPIPPDRPRPRSPFPWGPTAIVTIGILSLLLAVSLSFNVWLIAGPGNRFRLLEMEARRAEQEAMMQAMRAKEMALMQEAQAREIAQKQMALLQRERALRENIQDPQPEWGTLEGRVVWKGDLPNIKSFAEIIQRSQDKEHVLKGPKELLLDPTWRVDPKTKGVANVCVFLKRPKDGMLPIHADDKVRKDPIVIDAPFLVFEPHMVAAYPEWFDGKERGKTGQKLRFKNSSKAAYTARGMGVGDNPGFNFVVLPPSTGVDANVSAQKLPMPIVCNLHVWMHAYAWIFDHPYYAITKADGTFTIPRVPAGMEVQVMAWHEGQGWLLTKDGRAMELKQGKNVLDVEMSAK